MSIQHCSFCAKHKDSVEKLIVSADAAICSTCVALCASLIKEKKSKKSADVGIPDPHDISDFLDQYVIGQESAKVVLSVAIANHYKRINNTDNIIAKSNVLMIGPTGTGKTLMAKRAAEFLDVPFVVADATTLTESGYAGDDVESLISRLYVAADSNIERTQKGIVFLDEIDKIARRGSSVDGTRDVSGEGVQQGLLKLIEGTKCRISIPGSRKSESSVEIDTTNILFIGSGAFVELEKILKKRLTGTAIGFSTHNPENSINEITPEDLTKFGMIPEFVGRFSTIVSLSELTEEQLINILTKVKDNYIEQYKWLFDQDGVILEFEQESIESIAKSTLKNKTGARGLQTELQRVLLPHMFDLSRYRREGILKVAINKELVIQPKTLIEKK
jgi:ATP-dependent Clp protease ATP-binding subunit ClpX